MAFVGTLNPSSGDVSIFLPLEHARIAEAAQGDVRTTMFARYSLTGALCAALGALAAAMPEGLVGVGVDLLDALRLMFLFYGAVGLTVWLLYLQLPNRRPIHSQHCPRRWDPRAASYSGWPLSSP